jgi:hypothetical protein
MSTINFKDRYPTLLSKIEDEIDELRYLVVVDENYEDIDDEELDVFDPNDYNYLVYLTERVYNALGKKGMQELYETLDKKKVFDDFLASEEDLYGIKSDLSEDEIALKILDIAEEIAKKS